MKAKNKYYLIRHGETNFNKSGKHQGWSNDSKLTKTGKLQIEKLCKSLQILNIDIFYSSSLHRAQESTKIIQKILDITYVADDRLRDFRISKEFEGKQYNDLVKKYRLDLYEVKIKEDLNYSFPDGDSINSFNYRIMSFIDEIENLYKCKKIAIITHKPVIKEILNIFDRNEYFEVTNANIINI